MCIIITIIILSFALLATLLSFPQVAAQEQIRLEALTDQGTFRVEIIWTSNDIGSANTFDIRFIDPDTDSEIEDVKYDISIYRDGRRDFQMLDQISTFQEFSFEEQGSYEIRIEDIEDLGEGVTIPIQVTPEFQLEVFFAMFAAAGLGVAVIASRHNGNNLFRPSIY